MALHRITFHEQGGYTVTCRVRALVDRPTLLDLAVQKIWGPGHYWAWVPGSATEGRVYQQLTTIAALRTSPAPSAPRWRLPKCGGGGGWSVSETRRCFTGFFRGK